VLPNQEGFAIQNKIFGFNFQFKKKSKPCFEKMLNFGSFWFNQNTGAEILTFVKFVKT